MLPLFSLLVLSAGFWDKFNREGLELLEVTVVEGAIADAEERAAKARALDMLRAGFCTAII